MKDRKVSVKSVKATEEYCHCEGCGARNYRSICSRSNDDWKVVDVLFKANLGCMANFLCEDCLKVLIGEAAVALAKNATETAAACPVEN